MRKRRMRRRLTLRDRLHDDLCIAVSNGRNAVLDTLSSVALEINRYRAALMPDVDIESVRLCPSPNCFGLCFRKEKEFKRGGEKYVLVSHKRRPLNRSPR